MKLQKYQSTPEVLSAGTVAEFTPVDEAGRLLVSSGGVVVTVTPTLDTAIYAAADCLFDTTAIASASFQAGGHCRLESILVLDEDDQGVAMDLIFLDAATSVGTANAAFAASDTLARAIVGRVNIATGDYVDLGGFRIAQKSALGMLMKQGAGLSSLYVAGITQGGTPTYTASGLKFKFGFSRV